MLAISLFLSCIIGVYYGIMDQKKKRNTTEHYLMAGRKASIIPVSVSMIVTIYSATSFMANPFEVYYYGVVYWTSTIGYALAIPVIAHFIAPVFHNMTVVSANEVRCDATFSSTKYWLDRWICVKIVSTG